jgi:hypothetical protein
MNDKSPSKQLHIGTGKTPRGNTDWKPVPREPLGICVQVDTSSAGFKTTPNYVASLAGHDYHWMLTGTSAIYDPTPTGFTINLRWWNWEQPAVSGHPGLPPLTREFANQRGWHVTWIGAEESTSKQ